MWETGGEWEVGTDSLFGLCCVWGWEKPFHKYEWGMRMKINAHTRPEGWHYSFFFSFLFFFFSVSQWNHVWPYPKLLSYEWVPQIIITSLPLFWDPPFIWVPSPPSPSFSFPQLIIIICYVTDFICLFKKKKRLLWDHFIMEFSNLHYLFKKP